MTEWIEVDLRAPSSGLDVVAAHERGLIDAGPKSGPPNLAQGTTARPGTAEVFVYPDCRDGRLVADVMRMDKGHTEGLEPNVTERLVQLMVAAPGDRLQKK